jgi:hypothetical protein
MFPRKNRVARLVEQLRTPDEAVQHEAIEALESLSNSRITAQEARTALEAARERFPHPEAQELLLQIAYESPDPDFIPIIERDFLHYSPDARSWALRTLAAIGTEDAVRLLAMLLTRHAEDIEELSLLELEKQPQHATTLFPTLLAVLAREGASQHHFEIARLCLEYLRQGALASEDIRDAAPNLIACYDSLTDELARYQSPDKIHAIWDDEDYLWARSLACLLLDLMGYVDTPEVRQRLNNALEYIDARPLLFATTSLVQLGAPVPPWEAARCCCQRRDAPMAFRSLAIAEPPRAVPASVRQPSCLSRKRNGGLADVPHRVGLPARRDRTGRRVRHRNRRGACGSLHLPIPHGGRTMGGGFGGSVSQSRATRCLRDGRDL